MLLDKLKAMVESGADERAIAKECHQAYLAGATFAEIQKVVVDGRDKWHKARRKGNGKEPWDKVYTD